MPNEIVKRGRRKVGRPRKKPGEPVVHRLTPKVQAAIEAMVAGDLTVKEAAAAGGLTDRALYIAMSHALVMAFYAAETDRLKRGTKHRAVHAARKELKGPNASARVAAARIFLEEGPNDRDGLGRAQIQAPGVTIVIQQAPTVPTIDTTPTIEHEPSPNHWPSVD
jgi:hypothetical protein